MLSKNELIARLKLEPLTQEGGYYRRIYESLEKDTEGRRYSASIYYLLESPDFSCFHRLDCDELWHFYAGDSLVLHQLLPSGELRQIYLGNPLTDAEASPFAHIEKGTWFAAEVKRAGGFSLVGCTTTPEFVFHQFEAGGHKQLSGEYPEHHELIARLTRE